MSTVNGTYINGHQIGGNDVAARGRHYRVVGGMRVKLFLNRRQLTALKAEADGQFLADLEAAKLVHGSRINFVVWTDESNLPPTCRRMWCR